MTLTSTAQPARGGTALITGVTGFVGRHLARRLTADGWSTHGVTRSHSTRRPALPVDVVVHSVSDPVSDIRSVVDSINPDVVFHLAAYIGGHEGRLHEMFDTNVALPAAVAEAASLSGARLVYVGSAWQHYEGAEYSPVSLYGASKQAQRDVVSYFTQAEALDAREVCLFDNYGPDDDRSKLLTLLLDAAATGDRLLLSSGRQLVDLTHVADVADGLIRAGTVDGPIDRAVIRSTAPLTVRMLADVVAHVTGREIRAQWGGRPERPREMITDWRVSSDDIGWTPTIPLEQGIAQLWEERTRGAV